MNIAKNIKIGDKTLTIETDLAKQADGSVTLQSGKSIVLVTAVTSHENLIGSIDYVGLNVNYQEKAYAAGRIPGGFNKREARTDREILYSRIIDRAIRPLIDENYLAELQITINVLSYDPDSISLDVMSIIGASLALQLSGFPFENSVAAVRLTEKGMFRGKNRLEMVIGATRNCITMIEASADEIASETIGNIITQSHGQLIPVLDAMDDFVKEKKIKPSKAINNKIKEIKNASAQYQKIILESGDLIEKFKEAIFDAKNKKESNYRLILTRQELVNYVKQQSSDSKINIINSALNKIHRELVRKKIISAKKRLDGRKDKDIRPITCQIGYLPSTHGSAIFNRGDTQVLSALTLGGGQDEQMRDSIEGVTFDNFILHYNFPPFATNEMGQMKGPGRREIGHGNLAYNSLKFAVPNKEQSRARQTIRIVSEVLSSDGSSSMATVCASSLAMRNAGVVTNKIVGGIAMGLIKEKNKIMILSDITGKEDALGDMDFKIAGTNQGITALQMDIKNPIDNQILLDALSQAKEGLEQIIDVMKDSEKSNQDKPQEYSSPQVKNISIEESDIRKIIGAGGRVIKDICEQSNSKVEVNNSGLISIMAPNLESLNLAENYIKEIIAGPDVNTNYEGKIYKIAEYGLFVRFGKNFEGLVHISEINGENSHGTNLEEIFAIEQNVTVKVIEVEKNTGRIRLSMKTSTDEEKNSGEIQNDQKYKDKKSLSSEESESEEIASSSKKNKSIRRRVNHKSPKKQDNHEEDDPQKYDSSGTESVIAHSVTKENVDKKVENNSINTNQSPSKPKRKLRFF